MKTNFKSAAILLLALSPVFQAAAFAGSDTVDPAYFGIKSESVELADAKAGELVSLDKPVLLGPVRQNKDIAAAAALINTGIAAWNVVSGGAPSGSASGAYTSALPPAFYSNWSIVANWKGPAEHTYIYTVTNLMGVDVIKVKYKISYFYGGTEDYKGRQPGPNDVTGKYITNFTVKATEVSVKWGWHFNLDVKMSNPMNVGTPLKPVAALQADLAWSVSNMLSTNGGIWAYSIDGNGKFRDENAENKAMTKGITPVIPLETPAISWN